MNDWIQRNILRVVAFSAFPVLMVFGLGFVAWPSIYFTAPIFFPFATYAMDIASNNATIFHTGEFGLWFFGAYSLVIALLATWFSQGKGWRSACLRYAAVVALGALVVHVALSVLGFQYFMETP